MKIPKVLVFTITYEGKDYCFDEFKEQVSKLNYPNFRHIWIDNSKTLDYVKKLESEGLDAYHVDRGNNTREALARSQNFARKIAIEEGYDYILSLESDLFDVPSNIIQHLISQAKEMVGCFYLIGDKDYRRPCVTVNKEAGDSGLVGTRLLNQQESADILQHKGLHAVNGCGLGCTLIAREVFEKIGFMYYPDLKAHSDVFFANAVWENGFRVFLDSTIVLDHKNVPWSGVEDR